MTMPPPPDAPDPEAIIPSFGETTSDGHSSLPALFPATQPWALGILGTWLDTNSTDTSDF